MIDTPKNRFAALMPALVPVLVLLVLTATAAPAAAQGFDRVRDRNGTTSGKISKISALGVTLTKNGVTTKKPTEEILSITFAGEPEELSPVRRALKAGHFENALEKLKKIDNSKVTRPEVEQEINYFTTYCNAQLALTGQGSLDQARQQTSSFLSKHNKSYHVPAAIELLGDILMAKQDYAGAQSQFRKLGKAPSAYFKARSAILLGRSLQAQGKHKEAVASFDNGLAEAAKGSTTAKSQAFEAKLFRAVSQSALGDATTSTDEVKKIIKQTDTENVELLALAYNALGDCYLQANKKQEARQAFLHVDLLFSAATAEHAKALHHLVKLWDELGQPERASDAKTRLQKQYPGSRWAKM